MYGFLLVFFSNLVPKMHRFWDIRLASIQWPWNPWNGSLKVIENYTIQSGTHDFLLTFHSNHRPVSHRFRDKRRYPSKIARKLPIIPTPMYLTPTLKGFSLEFGIDAGVRRNWNDGATRRLKKFSDRFSCFDTVPACDGHPATQPDTLP